MLCSHCWVGVNLKTGLVLNSGSMFTFINSHKGHIQTYTKHCETSVVRAIVSVRKRKSELDIKYIVLTCVCVCVTRPEIERKMDKMRLIINISTVYT